MSSSISNQTLFNMAIGAVAGYIIATQFMKEEPLVGGGSDELAYFLGSDDTPPATAPLGGADADLGPVSALGARSLGASRLGGAALGSAFKPRRVYNDATSNNPAGYRPPSNSLFAPKPATPATKAVLKPATAVSAVKPKTGGALLKPTTTKALKSTLMPEIDTRDGLIVQPFN